MTARRTERAIADVNSYEKNGKSKPIKTNLKYFRYQ